MGSGATVKSRFSGLSSSTAGYVAVGVSVFILLASGPRILGGADYTSLALAWTVASIFGLGLAFPAEQTVTRAVAAGTQTRVATVVTKRLAVIVAAATVAAAGLFTAGEWPLPGEKTLWFVWVWVSLLGWVCLCGPRGMLAGQGQFRSYAAALFAEAASRVGFVAAAWFAPHSISETLLYAAVGVPLIISAATAWWEETQHRRKTGTDPVGKGKLSPAQVDVSEPSTETGGGTLKEQAGITAVALALQIVLNTAPLWIVHYPGVAPSDTGMFVSATTYMRIPLIFVGAATVWVLAGASRLSAAGNLHGLKVFAAKSVGASFLFAALMGAGLWLFGGFGMEMFYGPDGTHAEKLLGLLAVNTAVLVAASIFTQIFLGCRRSGFAAVVWITVAAVTTAALACTRTISGSIWVMTGAAILVLVVFTTVFTYGKIWQQAEETSMIP